MRWQQTSQVWQATRSESTYDLAPVIEISIRVSSSANVLNRKSSRLSSSFRRLSPGPSRENSAACFRACVPPPCPSPSPSASIVHVYGVVESRPHTDTHTTLLFARLSSAAGLRRGCSSPRHSVWHTWERDHDLTGSSPEDRTAVQQGCRHQQREVGTANTDLVSSSRHTCTQFSHYAPSCSSQPTHWPTAMTILHTTQQRVPRGGLSHVSHQEKLIPIPIYTKLNNLNLATNQLV